MLPLPVEVSSHYSDPPNPWAGYRRALEAGLDDGRPTHVLVLQEDVVVATNFTHALGRIAVRHPQDPTSFFLARLPGYAGGEVFQAAKRGDRYIRAYPGDRFFPALAILWPRGAALDFLEWVDSGVKLPGWPNPARSDDAIFGEWIRRTQRTAWYTVPSLVDHPDEAESTIGKTAQWGRDRNRTARMFCDGDAMAYEW